MWQIVETFHPFWLEEHEYEKKVIFESCWFLAWLYMQFRHPDPAAGLNFTWKLQQK